MKTNTSFHNQRVKCQEFPRFSKQFQICDKIYRFSRSRNAPNLKNQSEIILKLLFRVVSSLDVPRSRVDPCELWFTQFNQSKIKQLHETFCFFNVVVGCFRDVKCQPPQKTTVRRTDVVNSLTGIFLFEVKDLADFKSFLSSQGSRLYLLCHENTKTGRHSQEPHSCAPPFAQLNCVRLIHLFFQLSILFSRSWIVRTSIISGQRLTISGQEI